MIALSVPVLLSRGGEEDPEIRLLAPKAVPVGKTLIAKAEPVTSIPGGGTWVWKIKSARSLWEPGVPDQGSGTPATSCCGVVRLVTPALDPSLDPAAVKITGVKPGRVELVAEYHVGRDLWEPNGPDPRSGPSATSHVLASASQTIVILSALIETDGEAVEGEPEPVTLVVVPPPDPQLEFQLDGTTLTLVVGDAAASCVHSRRRPLAGG
jgi:hypothetical protein